MIAERPMASHADLSVSVGVAQPTAVDPETVARGVRRTGTIGRIAPKRPRPTIMVRRLINTLPVRSAVNEHAAGSRPSFMR